MMQAFKIKKPNFLIPNGLDMREFEVDLEKKKAKELLGIDSNSILISFLGRLNWVKGLDVLLKAFVKAYHKFSEAVLVLAGPDGGEKMKLEEISKELRVESRVLFIGPVDSREKMSLFAASDIFALVSWTENFGYAAVEAMAAGVPVLVSENVGICDAVREDGAGLVVPVDEEAIAEALIEMLSNPDKLREMGEAAYESARKRYDIRVVAELMAKAYEDVLTGRRIPECNWEGG